MRASLIHLRPTEKIMAQNGTIAYVNTLPKCDFPHAISEQPPAEYDFRTADGRWGNGCAAHYKLYRMHDELGTGKGQRLEVRPDIVGPVVPAGGVAPNERDSSDLV